MRPSRAAHHWQARARRHHADLRARRAPGNERLELAAPPPLCAPPLPGQVTSPQGRAPARVYADFHIPVTESAFISVHQRFNSSSSEGRARRPRRAAAHPEVYPPSAAP